MVIAKKLMQNPDRERMYHAFEREGFAMY